MSHDLIRVLRDMRARNVLLPDGMTRFDLNKPLFTDPYTTLATDAAEAFDGDQYEPDAVLRLENNCRRFIHAGARAVWYEFHRYDDWVARDWSQEWQIYDRPLKPALECLRRAAWQNHQTSSAFVNCYHLATGKPTDTSVRTLAGLLANQEEAFVANCVLVHALSRNMPDVIMEEISNPGGEGNSFKLPPDLEPAYREALLPLVRPLFEKFGL